MAKLGVSEILCVRRSETFSRLRRLCTTVPSDAVKKSVIILHYSLCKSVFCGRANIVLTACSIFYLFYAKFRIVPIHVSGIITSRWLSIFGRVFWYHIRLAVAGSPRPPQLVGQIGKCFEHRLDLLLVGGHWRDVGRHYQHALGINRGLRVVALLKAFAGGGHDARVFVGPIGC